MGSLFRELQSVLSVYLGIMVEGAVTGLSAVAIPAMLRCLLFPSLIGSYPEMQKVIKIAEINFWPQKISTKNGPKMTQNDPQIAQKMTQNFPKLPKMTQNCQNGPKISSI